MTLGRCLAAALLGGVLAISGAALSGPKHCPPGHAKKGWCTPGTRVAPPYRERPRDDAYERGYQDGLLEGWRRGDMIPRRRYRIIDNYDDYGWRRPEPDQYYVVVDGKYYLIKAATGVILDLLLR